MPPPTDNPNAALLKICWLLMLAWTLISVVSVVRPDLLSPNTGRFINVTLMSVFVLAHGAMHFGARVILSYFVIAVVVTNITENASIISGFPFGQYHHTQAMGPQLIHVPLIVGPIFAVAGYLAWMLSGLLLGDTGFQANSSTRWARVLIAALITTSWDLCVDAIGGTVNRDWVWADGGPWFGVPLLNFFGWVLTMWIIFELFSRYLKRCQPTAGVAVASAFWLQPIVFWLLMAAQFPLVAILVPDFAISDPTGAIWQSADLLQSMALTSAFTMGFVCLLSYAQLTRARELQRS